MKAMDTRRYEMLVRVRDFGDAYGHLFPESSVARQKFAEIAAAVKRLDAYALTHMTASVAADATQKARARAALTQALHAVAQTARVLARETPGLDREFELPRRATDQTKVTAGRKFARDAEPLRSRFIAHGMPATFVADLDAVVEAFERATRDFSAGRGERLAARTGIGSALAAGLAAVQALDVIVTNHLRDNEVACTVWERDRRTGYPQKDAAPAPATPAAPAPEGSSTEAA